MLPLGALFAFAGQQFGRVLSLAFSWATLILFGQVSKDRQPLLSLMAALSLVWPIALAGVALPSVGTFLLGLVTVPGWLDNWVRLAMLALAVAAPLGVGYAASRLRDRPPRGVELARALLSGYPNAVALAVVLVWLMVLAPALKLSAILRRWESAHVPIAVRPGGYDTVVRDLADSLERAGVPVRHRTAPWPLAVPGRVVAALGGRSVRALVPTRLVQLRGHQLVITIHPMDLGLQGRAAAVARARAALVRELSFTDAYQTWTKEAQDLEDQLARAARGEVPLAPLGRRLETVVLPFEEWAILYRMLLQARLRRNPIGTDALGSERNGRPSLLRRVEAAIEALRSPAS